jgi:hypothetical protein
MIVNDFMIQVAAIVIMALSGSFVPASYAQIPLFDKIFTRIHATESVSTGLSSFMVDLSQVFKLFCILYWNCFKIFSFKNVDVHGSSKHLQGLFDHH